MGTGDYFGAPSQAPALPTSVKTVRVLLYIVAGFTVLTTVGVLLAAGASPEIIGQLIWAAWPGVLGFIVALKLNTPSRLKFWLIIVAAAFLILGGLGNLGQGDPRGFTTLILPILILVFVLQRSARQYFFR